MKIQELYQTLQEVKDQKDCILASVVEGKNQGEKILLADQKVIASISCTENPDITNTSAGSLFLLDYLERLILFEKTGIYEMEGQKVFVERVGTRPRIVICGGGHVSIALLRLVKFLGYEAYVLEDRPLFANHAREAGADVVICDSFENAMKKVPDSIDNYYTVLTRGHRYDKECLKLILNRHYAYVGMMGSRRRVSILKNELLEEGYSSDAVGVIHTPIGLSIGAQTPEEIAVSIVAELVQERRRIGKLRWINEEIINQLMINETKVLCTIISKKGSAPREPGTRMIVTQSGDITGTIGGGCVEAEVITNCRRILSMKPIGYGTILKMNMTADTAEEEGMVCGGVIDIYLEKL